VDRGEKNGEDEGIKAVGSREEDGEMATETVRGLPDVTGGRKADRRDERGRGEERRGEERRGRNEGRNRRERSKIYRISLTSARGL